MPADPRLHATHDPELVAAYAAGDATGSDLAAAEGLVAGCADCATLHRDLRAIMAALPRVPAPVRRRDFRLTPEQAAAIRPPSRFDRILGPLAGARFAFAGPAGAGLAALGLAGILLSGGLNVQPPSSAAGGNAAAGPESGAVTSLAGAKDAGSAAPSMAFGPTGPADRVVPSPAPSMVAAPASPAASSAPPSGFMAIRPGPTASDGMVDNGVGPLPPSPGGAIAAASAPPVAPPASDEAAAGGASMAITPPPSSTSPVAALGIGLVVAGLLLAGTRQVARRLA
jgi:hypothetical protein